METIRVALADAPTDVLAHLVDAGPQTAGEIVEHFESVHEGDITLTVVNSLGLLERAGYACYNGTVWHACDDGVKAIEAARERAR